MAKDIKGGEFLYPLTDTGFKVIFGTPENKRLLIDFLNCLLKGEQKIVDIDYSDKEQVSDVKEERDIIYDIFCKTDKGEYVIVEMQRQRHYNFIDRTIYYASRAISRQGRKGSLWQYDIKTVYCVAFMNFTNELFGDNLCTSARLTIDGNGKQLSPVLRFFYIQLPFAKEADADTATSLESWTYILRNMEALKLPRYSDNQIFGYLKEVTDVAALSPAQRRRYERDLRNYWDACAVDKQHEVDYQEATEKGLAEGLAKGLAQGLAEGRAEGEASRNIALARNLMQMNMSFSDISMVTGLSIDEIKALSLK
jgi:predicted transposase/invertase (TIGR01784 family)